MRTYDIAPVVEPIMPDHMPDHKFANWQAQPCMALILKGEGNDECIMLQFCRNQTLILLASNQGIIQAAFIPESLQSCLFQLLRSQLLGPPLFLTNELIPPNLMSMILDPLQLMLSPLLPPLLSLLSS